MKKTGVFTSFASHISINILN